MDDIGLLTFLSAQPIPTISEVSLNTTSTKIWVQGSTVDTRDEEVGHKRYVLSRRGNGHRAPAFLGKTTYLF